MECAARSSYLVRALEGFSGLQVSRAPGSTVVSSHSSPADLAANHQLRSRRWSVDVGIANAISKPGLSQGSSAGQSCCSCADQHGGAIGFILGEYGQAMRASLFAKATAATLPWVRVVSWASHALRPEDCFALCCRTARAPCTKSLPR